MSLFNLSGRHTFLFLTTLVLIHARYGAVSGDPRRLREVVDLAVSDARKILSWISPNFTDEP